MTDLCPNKELCGSCGWSHIPYGKQLAQKLADINYSFEIHKHDFRCNDIEPSPKTSHYRNRMDFVIDFEGRVGLREKGKWWRVIDNHACFISDKMIEELFTIVKTWVGQSGLSYYDRKSYEGLLRYAVIRAATTGESMVTIVTSNPKDTLEGKMLHEKLQELLSQLTSNQPSSQPVTLIHSINYTISDVSHGGNNEIISGMGRIIEEINGLKYTITPNAFFQTNSYGAKLLMSTVLDYAKLATSNKPTSELKIILDLYCGSGFFTIPLSKLAGKTIGVEIVEDAKTDAKENNKLNGTNAEFFAVSSGEYDWIDLKPDLVIVDPPRAGLDKPVLSDLLTFQPPNLIYISCNYKNFSKDMELLNGIYEVVQMKAIDMFPHTPHVELVTLMHRK